MKRKILLTTIYIILLVAISFTVILSLRNYNLSLKQKKIELTNNLELMSYNNIDSKEFSDLVSKVNNDFIKGDYFLFKNGREVSSSTNDKNLNKIITEKVNRYLSERPQIRESYIEVKNSNNIYYIIKELSDEKLLVGTFTYNSMLSETLKTFSFSILPIMLGLILIPSFIRSVNSSLDDNLFQISTHIKEFIESGYYDIEVDSEFDEFLYRIKSEVSEVNENLYKIQSHVIAIDKVTKNMNEGFIIINNEKKVVSINESAVKLLNASYLVDYTDKKVLNLCRDQDFQNAINNSLENEEYGFKQIHINERHLKIYLNPIYSRNRNIFGLIILLLDETKEYESEKIRREFSSNISHELKTPLTSISGYAELLKSGEVNKENTIKFSTIILDESSRLIELIDEIISLSRLEEKKLQENVTRINLLDLADETVSNLALSINSKKIKVNVIGDENLFINANLITIKELFYNLIDNAIKYNVDNGKIDILIFADESGNIILEFKDSGIGISHKDQGRVFERFYMADKSRSYNKKSTGLGLSIVKHIVEYYQGDIELKSQLNIGSTFKITLPKELRA